MFESLHKKPLDFIEPPKKIGLISFTDPRSEVQFVSKREEFIQKEHTELVAFLEKNNIIVVSPQSERNLKSDNGLWGINNFEDVLKAANGFITQDIAALIFGCFAWNEPDIPLELAKKIDVPIALVTTSNPKWPGVTALTSTGASFWQSSYSYYIKNHERFIIDSEKDKKEFLPWIKATTTVKHLQDGKLLLWGGTPALHMEHLNDDIPLLKRFIINDIITQDQYILVKKAEKLLQEKAKRIDLFKDWLIKNGCKIIFDENMLTEDSLKKQIAFYLAAKDVILEHHLKGERVIGASIKCQPELSVEYGVTPCLIPAFLPFPVDSEGKKPIIPTVCEGDIKGLLTSTILYGFNNKIPPLFGDLKIITDNYFIIANCGAASAYYAGNSNESKTSLSNSTLQAQCQGESGGAFGYYTPKNTEIATYARLIRIDTEYILQYGLGKVIAFDSGKEIGWGTSWPHTTVELHASKDLFIKAIGTNHLSLTYGNLEKELDYLVKLLGISKVRLDSNEDIETFINNY